jgi:NAD+ kinase
MRLLMAAPSQAKRILLVRKTTAWERHQRFERDRRGGDAGAALSEDVTPEVTERLETAHQEHMKSLEAVHAVLETRGHDVREVRRPTRADTQSVDLVVTVGGDGTFLRSALQVSATPMVGVNSSPTYSVGHYCGLEAETLKPFLESLDGGDEEVTWLPRIQGRIGRSALPHLALNDMLFCQRCPAASSRYTLGIDGNIERHISSGVWISTPSGSTSAIYSAGGEVVSHGTQGLQYLVREPYTGFGDPLLLTGGIVESPMAFTPTSPDLLVYLDGHMLSYDIPLAVTLRLERVERSLSLYRYTLR